MSRCSTAMPRLLLGLALIVLPAGCSDGSDGAPGPPGPNVINASTASPETLAGLDVVSQIESVQIASPPVVTFSLFTDKGVPIIGLVPFWEDSNSFVRFTITKLVAGEVFATGGMDPDSWVAYVRDNGEPDYDTGASLVDHEDGTYTFTFNTDVANVPGVPYEPTLTHRVAGQIGSSSVPLEAQNIWLDFVPAGGALTERRDIAVMVSCNECHDNLVFHGRRFQVEYCVQCHNPDLAAGEGNFAFMIHRIHSFDEFGGTFNTLGTRGGTRPPADFSEVTYPQDLRNCRKCHNVDDPATPQADNWRTLPNIAACDGCHSVFDSNNNFANITHSGPALTDNMLCSQCHGPGKAVEIEANHTTPNFTPNNPGLLAGQRNITYEMVDASVDGSNNVTVQFRILSDGIPLDVTNLPADLTDGMGAGLRYPTLLFAWAMPQLGFDEPGDYNNMGQRGAQPRSVDLDELSPIETTAPLGTLSFNAMDGIMTATIMDADSQFPMGATMRAVGLQNYLQQDLSVPLDGTADVSLHTPSVVAAVTGDSVRREVVDTNGCSRCHEWFEGHGGNRVLGFGSAVVCVFCHNPNQSSSGRTVTDPSARGLNADLAAAIAAGTLSSMVDPNDPLTYPEDAQNFKDLVHGIHSEGFRDRPFQHVRGPGRQDYYDWDHVTFPRGASTSNCELCHMDDSYELPLADDLLPTTVRTTAEENGLDADPEAAFVGVPNDNDWVNSPTAAACLGCHTSTAALAHMSVNGGFVSDPRIEGDLHTNRFMLVPNFESCAVCHGPGRSADLEVVHGD